MTVEGEGRNSDNYIVFADPALTVGSAVIFLASADESESEGMKGTIVSVEPIPPTPDATDRTPPEEQ